MENKIDVAIIGGGISGLAALHFLKYKRPELKITLFESDKRLGGTIGTDRIDGYSFDYGPNGFLDREPLTLDLVKQIGLNDSIERANDKVTKRLILRKGKLREVPMSPQKFLVSDILSLKGKLRIMTEPFAKERDKSIDESIYDFVKRRIGKEAADYMIQPMVSGIYGGMADRLSLESCFPVMREMEDRYGSLIKAMFAKGKEAKKRRKEGNTKSGGPGGPTGWLTSFNGGLFKIIEQFESLYKDSILKGTEVNKVSKESDYYSLALSDSTNISADKVIFALPTYKAVDLVRAMSSDLADSFQSIPYAPIAVICTGYDKSQVGYDINGFGFLVPSKEGRSILGSIWTSSIFANRAPDGKVQFRTMIGGDGDHESINLSDDDLLKTVEKDLNDLLSITGKPEIVKIYRWHHGIPQFKIGHKKRVAKIEDQLKQLGNLYVTGNAYYGIGLNDCVKQSYKIADEILNSL